ncbi:ERC protein 2-like isoform 4 [Cricetulus griseus]|nr:ERC protein 2-like isoform 4 [Cricetulus griseus]
MERDLSLMNHDYLLLCSPSRNLPGLGGKEVQGHMKDQNKKVANLKHNQQLEKKKNAQLLEEVRRREDSMADNSQHLQASLGGYNQVSFAQMLGLDLRAQVALGLLGFWAYLSTAAS